jgi:hypothetical protein
MKHDSEELWYSPEDLDRIQEQDDEECLRAMSIQEAYSGFLDNVFIVTSQEEKNLQQVNLNCWSRYAHHLRGLETTVNKRHRVERFVQKSMQNKSVLVVVAQSVEMTKSDKAITIARISKRCSIRARKFAAATGTADEYAVRMQDGNFGK